MGKARNFRGRQRDSEVEGENQRGEGCESWLHSLGSRSDLGPGAVAGEGWSQAKI